MSEIPKNVVGQKTPKFTAEKLEAMREVVADGGSIPNHTMIGLIDELLTLLGNNQVPRSDRSNLKWTQHEAWVRTTP